MIADELFRRAEPGAVRRQVVAPGTVLVTEGEEPDGVHRLVDGAADVEVGRGDDAVRVAMLGPGALIGEIALLAGSLPTATVTLTAASTVESLDLDTARALVDEHPDLAEELAASARDRVDRGAVAQLLHDMLDLDDPELLAGLARELPRHRLSAGTTLLVPPDVADDVSYAVVSGRLAVRRDGVEVARLGRGQVVGAATLLAGGDGPAAVVAVRDSVVVEIRDEGAVAVLGGRPTVLAHVVRRLAELGRRSATSTRGVASTIAVVTTAPTANPRVVSTWVREALAPFGSVAALTPARVDADLQRPGIADSAPDDDAAPRLRAHLHELELQVERLLLEAGRDRPNWTRTACGVADRVLVVASAAPDAAEEADLRRVLAAAPSSTTTIVLQLHPEGTERLHGTASRRDELGVTTILHAKVGERTGIERAARITAGCAVGLVLGGGGARGYAHLGVQQALEEHSVPIDVLIGSSIGASLAGPMAGDHDARSTRDIVRRGFVDIMDYTVPVVALLKGDGLVAAIDTWYEDRDFEDLWRPFYCVTTNLTTSQTVVHSTGPTARAVRASVSVPGVFPPVPVGDDLLVDGGVLNNLPVDVAADVGVGTIIAVDVAPVTGPRARDDFGLSVSGWQALRRTLGRGRSEYPGITAVLLRSMIVGSVHGRARAVDEADVDLLLELPIRGVSMVAWDTVDEVADMGYELSEPLIAAWLEERGGWAG
jgi:predicted acylesterase/phospholipase RssA/CRP-like cAMP-binding protein